MLKKLIVILFLLSSIVMSQTDKTIDSLLYQGYKINNSMSKSFHYKCESISLFPIFVMKDKPIIYGNKECYKNCRGIYNKSVDKNGTIHLIISSSSYSSINGSVPNVINYSLFYFIKDNNIWKIERPTISTQFLLVSKNPLRYSPK